MSSVIEQFAGATATKETALPDTVITPQETMNQTRAEVLLTGATGYIGGLLLKRFENTGISVRCLARSPDKLRPNVADSTEVVKGDVLDEASVCSAMQGVRVVYYLVHSMSGADDFEEEDRKAANNFAKCAEAAGVERIIYLGGLGDDNEDLSPHLRSRQEVGRILRGAAVPTIEFRTAVVVGAGSLSFDMVRSLTDRLPVMICPRWLATPTQPIAVDDILDYLEAAKDVPCSQSELYEVGGADVVNYGDLIREYAKQKGLRRWLISVPLLTPYLSSLWLGLVTPASAEVGRHLIEGLRNPTVVRDDRALQAFDIRPMGIADAIRNSIGDS